MGSKASRKPSKAEQPNPKRRDRMPRAHFEAMCKAFDFYPQLVQTFSLNLHVDRSCERRGTSELTYAAFVETLCRIAFVYLSVYGNPIQQKMPSLQKCCWLLVLLRCRCEEFGSELKLPTGLRRGAMSKLWRERKPFVLETTPFEKLVMWRVLDSSCYKRGQDMSFKSQGDDDDEAGSWRREISPGETSGTGESVFESPWESEF